LLSMEWFGFIAGGITTFAVLPQVIRVFKLKSAREISLTFTTLMIIGLSCWLTYGIFLRLPPVILWNSIAIILFFAFLFAKLKYGRQA
jgi:MtN3 and saliva related transmembrane protein